MLTSCPKISILMPTYNRGAFIGETIESILNQTYQNWELIIVDDGSDDDTEEVISQVKDQRIRFYKAGRIAINGKIKNIGLEKAKGELIAFIDSDDLWAETKLEKQVSVLQEYPEAGFSLTGGFNFRTVNQPIDFFYKQREGLRYGDIFISIWEKRNEIPVTFSISRHLYTEVRKQVVKSLNSKLADQDEAACVETWLSKEFSIESLQAAKNPVCNKIRIINKPSEVVRQQTNMMNKTEGQSTLEHIKWIFHSLTNRLSLTNIMSYYKN